MAKPDRVGQPKGAKTSKAPPGSRPRLPVAPAKARPSRAEPVPRTLRHDPERRAAILAEIRTIAVGQITAEDWIRIRELRAELAGLEDGPQ